MSERSGTLGTVLRHEWRLLRADRAVVMVLVLFVALASYALGTGVRRASAHRCALERVAEASRRTVAELRQQAMDAERRLGTQSDGPPEYGPRDPEFVLAATRQRNVVLPPSPHEALACRPHGPLPGGLLGHDAGDRDQSLPAGTAVEGCRADLRPGRSRT